MLPSTYLKAMKYVVLVVAALLIAAPASAATTIEAFLPSCEATLKDPGDPAGFACAFYVSGIADVFTSHMLNWPACSPDGTTGRDIIRVFVAWAHQHPDVWQEHILRGVVASITEAYRC